MALVMGVAAIAIPAGAILLAQGAGQDAFDDIFRYGRALATDTLPDPNAPWFGIHWITGNADPAGRLPWPFGTTDYLVWWGTASWPLWLASIPSLACLLLGSGTTPGRRLVAGWAIAAWAQVTLPGLYWQHYYLLPIAGAAIAVGKCFADATFCLLGALRPTPPAAEATSRSGPGWRRIVLAAVSVPVLATSIALTVFLEVRGANCCLRSALPTVQFKGGGTMGRAARSMGRDLRRTRPDLGRAAPVHLGMAEPAPFLRANG